MAELSTTELLQMLDHFGDAKESLGAKSVLRSSSDETIAYWDDHAADLRRQLRAEIERLSKPAAVRPLAWIRMAGTPGMPHAPPEIDCECVAGDESPDDSGAWVPLYRQPAELVVVTEKMVDAACSDYFGKGAPVADWERNLLRFALQAALKAQG